MLRNYQVDRVASGGGGVLIENTNTACNPKEYGIATLGERELESMLWRGSALLRPYTPSNLTEMMGQTQYQPTGDS